jgi:transcriptional regulator with XRE-family HTH domain
MAVSVLGQRIVVLRRRRDMKQRELAEAAEISVDVIRKLEQGQRQPARLETLTALANALDAPLAELVVAVVLVGPVCLTCSRAPVDDQHRASGGGRRR